MENDTPQGGESLSIEQAAAAFVKSTAAPEVGNDHTSDDEVETQSDDTTDDELQVSDEDAGEETDGETATEDDAEQSDDDESDPESEQGRFVADNAKVRLPDGTITTVHELKRGSLREADYTRKTQETAALHSETVAQRERIQQREEQLNQQAEYVTNLVRSIVPPPPAIELMDTDPMGYFRQERLHKEWAQHLSYLEQQQQQAKQAGSAEAEKKQRETADREWNTLMEKVPAFRDQKRTEAFVNDSLKFGTETYGFTKDELRQALGLDHRQVLVLKDAISWRKLQASKTNVQKKVEGRPPIQKGGKRLNPAEHRSRSTNDALSRLKQSGSVEDATAAYIASLNKG